MVGCSTASASGTAGGFGRIKMTADPMYEWVKGRILAVKQAGYGGELAARWPTDIPTFKQSDQHTDEQLEAILEQVRYVEGDHLLPFGEPDPRIADRPNHTL